MLRQIMVKNLWHFENYKKVYIYKDLNISLTNVSRLKFRYVMHLCKSFEYDILIFENCAVSELTIKKYVNAQIFLRLLLRHDFIVLT